MAEGRRPGTPRRDKPLNPRCLRKRVGRYAGVSPAPGVHAFAKRLKSTPGQVKCQLHPAPTAASCGTPPASGLPSAKTHAEIAPHPEIRTAR